MSESIKLQTFPKDEFEALAIAYVQGQNLKGLSTNEVYNMYLTAYYEFKAEHALKKRDGYFREQDLMISEILRGI